MITPYISRENVSSALSSLIHSSRDLKSNGLRHLLLVDLLLINPALPPGDNMRDYALKEVLVSTIISALSEHRAVFLLSPINQTASVDAVRYEIADTVEQGSTNLTIWSLLYYRYVRVDLNFSVEALSEVLAIHSRTISRYIEDGTELLKERLISAELAARQVHNRRRLYAALPYPVPVRILGREHLFQQVRELLGVISPFHILVTGKSGIGKTTFVQEVLRQEIDADRIDQLIWIENPSSVHFARQLIRESFQVDNQIFSIREYLALYRLVLVLDGISALATEQTEFEELLRELGAASVFLINPIPVSISGLGTHITLPEISLDAAYELVSELLPGREVDEKHEYTHILYNQFGGNPLAFRLGTGFLTANQSFRSVQNQLSDSLTLHLFTSLGLDAQRAWCVLSLLSSGIGKEELLAVWGIEYSTLLAMFQLGLLEMFEDAVFISSNARDFIREHYNQKSPVRQLVDSIVEEISLENLQASSGVFDLVELALVIEFPQLSEKTRNKWIHASWKEGLKRNHWSRWRIILEQHFARNTSNDHSLLLPYAMCLRRLGEVIEAEKLLHELIVEKGRLGQFLEQSQALIEWSVLVRQQGKFESAASTLQQVKRYAERRQDKDLLRTVEFQRAEILVQQSRADEALEILMHLPQNAAVLSLQSEAQLVLGNYELCRQFALQALEMMTNSKASQAKLYTIMGKSYEEENEHKQMRQCFSMAVTQFERLDDLFSLARSETNLAVSLMFDGQFGDAEILLSRSEIIQERLGDALGLSVTKHNQRVLAGYIAN